MSIAKVFRNSGRTVAVGTAMLAAIALTAAPGSANAQHRGGPGGPGHPGWHGGPGGPGWHGNPGWRGDHWRGHHRHHRHGWRGDDAAAWALLGGTLAGAAIASTANPYYWQPYPYGYAYPYYYRY